MACSPVTFNPTSLGAGRLVRGESNQFVQAFVLARLDVLQLILAEVVMFLM